MKEDFDSAKLCRLDERAFFLRSGLSVIVVKNVLKEETKACRSMGA